MKIASPGDEIKIEWDDIEDFSDEDWNGDPEVIDTPTHREPGYTLESITKDTRCIKSARTDCLTSSSLHGVRAIPIGCCSRFINVTTGREWELEVTVKWREVTQPKE